MAPAVSLCRGIEVIHVHRSRTLSMTTNETDFANTGEERAERSSGGRTAHRSYHTEAVVEEATEVVETAAAEEVVAEVEEEDISPKRRSLSRRR